MPGPLPPWRTVLATVVIAYGILILGGAVLVYSGAYDIGADVPHWRLTNQLLDTARIRSIRVHAAGLTPPAGLDSDASIVMGAGHYADHCAICHGGPGVPKGDIGHGLYPQPPDLAITAKTYSDGELFWILKHGIKLTGMPAWSDHSDEELWATAAFLRNLSSGMTEQQYGELIKAAIAHGGHHHMGERGPAGTASGAPGADQHRH